MSETLLSPSAPAPQPLGTFARAIIVETSGHLGWRTVDYAVSLAIHVAILGALSILPLFLLKQLRPYVFTRAVFIAATPSASQEPQPRPNSVRPASPSAFDISNLAAPLRRTSNAITTSAETPLPPELISMGIKGGIGNLLDGGLNSLPFIVPVPPPSDRLILIGGNLKDSRLIYGLSLAYPSIARAFHVFGKVVIEALIDESGNVQNVRAVSGPGLLINPALDAVSREKFEPAMLNGQPTPRSLQVEINFRLYD